MPEGARRAEDDSVQIIRVRIRRAGIQVVRIGAGPRTAKSSVAINDRCITRNERGRIKAAKLVVPVRRLTEVAVTNSKIQRQSPRRLPVVLNIGLIKVLHNIRSRRDRTLREAIVGVADKEVAESRVESPRRYPSRCSLLCCGRSVCKVESERTLRKGRGIS